jgi:YVTN family beta-propeller protein
MRRSLVGLALLMAGTKSLYGVDAAYISGNDTSEIFVFDLVTHTQILTIGVGFIPNQTSSADGTRVYVQNQGDGNISVIDAVIGTVIATVTTGNIRSMALNADNSKLYVPTFAGTVLVIDTTSFLTIATITALDGADIVAGPANMYLGNQLDPIVRVISGTTETIIATITVGGTPFNLHFVSPYVYSVNDGTDNISLINIGTNQVIATVTVGDSPRDIGVINDLAFVANSQSVDFSVIDILASPPAVIATVSLSGRPQLVTVNALRQKVYIGTAANGGDPTTLNAIDATPPFPVLATITVDAFIKTLDFTPDETQLYMTLTDTPWFNIIDTSTDSIIVTVLFNDPLGANDVAFAIQPPIPPPPPSAGIQMPTFVRGSQTKNEFLGQTELVNVLTWAPPSSGATPVTYLIYRNPNLTDLAGTVPASGALQFSDHSRRKKVTYIYYIVSVDSTGTRSAPAILAVAP